MTATPTNDTQYQVELGDRTPFDNSVPLGSIDSNKPKPILLNVESGVKSLISAIAKNQKIDGVDIDVEKFEKLPNSITGVVMHFVVEGLKNEFSIRFDKDPTSLTIRGTGNKFDKKVEGKKRLLTRDQKNEILARMDMRFYMDDVMSGKLSTEDAMEGIKEAFNTKKEFEDMGYILPDKKTAYPFWKEGAGEEVSAA
jgi:hypothetical protein